MATLDTLVSWIYRTVLNPWLTVPATAGYILKNPEQLQVVFPSYKACYIPSILTSPWMAKVLYAIAGSLALRFQGYLSQGAMNNWTADKYDWAEEVVVVTGGAGGIGGEIVKQLSSKGTRIAVLDVLPLTYSPPANVQYFQCDLMDGDSLHAAAEEIRKKWGNPTVLCAIAGIVRGKPLFELTRRDLDLTFGVNTVGLAMCYKEFVPSMAKQNHGHVVTMASATAYLASCRMVDYAASKSAALALHEGLQTELKHIYKAPKVRCSVLCPSVVATKMFSGLTSPSNFVMPVLTPEQVAGAAVSAIWAGKARHIDIPCISRVIAVITNAFPVFWRIAIQDGGGGSMDSRLWGGDARGLRSEKRDLVGTIT